MNTLIVIIGFISIIVLILLAGYAVVGSIYKGAGGTHIYPKPPIAPKPN